MTRREILLSNGFLVVGLIIGAWKGDDVLEYFQGTDSISVSVDPELLLNARQRYEPRVLHHLTQNRPVSTYEMKFASLMEGEADCYRFDISNHDTGELVAVVRVAYEDEAISGGWVI